MRDRKIKLLVLLILFTTSSAFCQSEVFKSVVNNLAFYKQKKDLSYLAKAKKSVDSLITTHADSSNLQKLVYRAVVNSSILYIDSLNKLNKSAAFFAQTTQLVDKLSADKKIYRYQPEMEYARHCLANVFIRDAFRYMSNSDFNNALQLFMEARRYAPSFKPVNAYIAYSSNKLGRLPDAAKYYDNLIGTDSAKTEYIEAAVNIYEAMGDTTHALEIVKKARRTHPAERLLLVDEANIYNNRKDYSSLSVMLPELLELNPNNPDITFVGANCYDHLNQYDKAESLYLRTIELNNAAYEPIFNLGLLYLKQSEVKKGKNSAENMARSAQWLEKANEVSPNDVKCLHILQLVYEKTGNQYKATEINNKLKELTNQ